MAPSWFPRNQLRPGLGAASSRRSIIGVPIAAVSSPRGTRRWIMCAQRQQAARQPLGTSWHAVHDATARRGLSRGVSGSGVSRFGQPMAKPVLNAGSREHPVVSIHCLLIVDFSLPFLLVLTGDASKRYAPNRANGGFNLLHCWRCAPYHG